MKTKKYIWLGNEYEVNTKYAKDIKNIKAN